MDRPLPVRYLIYLRNLFTGDLGIDFDRRLPVFDLIAAAVPNTVRLALIVIWLRSRLPGLEVFGVEVAIVARLARASMLDVLTADFLLSALVDVLCAYLDPRTRVN